MVSKELPEVTGKKREQYLYFLEKSNDFSINQLEQYKFLILGVLLGIFGNILANGLWDYSNFNTWSTNQLLVFGFSIIFIFGITFKISEKISKTKEKNKLLSEALIRLR